MNFVSKTVFTPKILSSTFLDIFILTNYRVTKTNRFFFHSYMLTDSKNISENILCIIFVWIFALMTIFILPVKWSNEHSCICYLYANKQTIQNFRVKTWKKTFSVYVKHEKISDNKWIKNVLCVKGVLFTVSYIFLQHNFALLFLTGCECVFLFCYF